MNKERDTRVRVRLDRQLSITSTSGRLLWKEETFDKVWVIWPVSPIWGELNWRHKETSQTKFDKFLNMVKLFYVAHHFIKSGENGSCFYFWFLFLFLIMFYSPTLDWQNQAKSGLEPYRVHSHIHIRTHTYLSIYAHQTFIHIPK